MLRVSGTFDSIDIVSDCFDGGHHIIIIIINHHKTPLNGFMLEKSSQFFISDHDLFPNNSTS